MIYIHHLRVVGAGRGRARIVECYFKDNIPMCESGNVDCSVGRMAEDDSRWWRTDAGGRRSRINCGNWGNGVGNLPD